MAHGDALIFLTNIVWIFFLFLFVYLFFVVLFLPAFYKKFRIRVLVRALIKLVGVVSIRNILVSLTFFLDFVRGLSLQILGFVRSLLFYFNVRRTFNFEFFAANGSNLVVKSKYSLNKNLFIGTSISGVVNFVKFRNY